MTGASATTTEIKTFFARYGDAFAARDKDALARCFLFPCHFVGDDGEITLTVISSVEQYLAEIIRPLFRGYRQLGVASGQIRDLQVRVLSPRYATPRFCGMSSMRRAPCCFRMKPPIRSPWPRATGASARLPITR